VEPGEAAGPPAAAPEAEVAAAEPEAPAEVAQIAEADLAALRAKAAERDALQDRVKRLAADFANAQKRIEREAQTRIEYALQDFVRDAFPVADGLERALRAAEETQNLAGLVEGIRLVEKQFRDVLARYGVEPIPTAKGEPFDPDLHEVLAVVPAAEYPEHSVVEEVEKGYRLKDRVVRHAKVVVAGPRPEQPGA